MRGSRPISVVILYTHPLLGEGLARMLAAELQVGAVAVPSVDLVRAEAALAGCPDVVIFEHNQPLQAIDLLKFAPNALLIDVGMDTEPAFTYRREEIPDQPEAILRAIAEVRWRAASEAVGAVGAVDGSVAVPVLAGSAGSG